MEPINTITNEKEGQQQLNPRRRARDRTANTRGAKRERERQRKRWMKKRRGEK
jgi:hypothetical protein